ncbi:MAG: T9SS type A sorting domain-containing protein [Flavobacteriales bacterium]|nr:T9SS type A sorting domain-containing protein [Flavobacteriales bacterium]
MIVNPFFLANSSHYPNGVYFVQVSDNQQISTTVKILKQ